MAVSKVFLLNQNTPTVITGGFVPKGAYAAGTDYAVGDSVDYNGSSYVMFVDAVAGTLPTDTTKWQVVANKGVTGATGAAGSTGATGATGATGVVQSVVAGNNIDVDATDPANPIVSVETLTLADISDVTASITELNYIDGVTSAIQTQLNAKAASLGADDNYVTDAQLAALHGVNDANTNSNSYADGKVSDAVYGAGWDGVTTIAPSKNAVYDKLELFAAGTGIDHGGLTGLGDDDHTQYALLAGRSGGQILKGGTGTTDDLTLQTTSGVGATGADMHFLVGNNGATEAMTILNSGDVGIGTTSPENNLDVYGSGFPRFTRFHTTTTAQLAVLDLQAKSTNDMVDGFGPQQRFYIKDTSDVNNLIASISAVRDTADTKGALVFNVGTSGSVEGMRINYLGNVGIGTVSPGYRLDIETTANTNSKFGTNKPIYLIADNPYVGFNTYYNSGWEYGAGSSGSYAALFGHNAGTGLFTIGLTAAGGNAAAAATIVDVFAIDKSGNVGIGTTNPATKLDVAGSIQVSSAVALSLGGYVRTYSEAVSAALSGATGIIAVNIPVGARLLGVQLRVDTLITSGDGATQWSAAYTGGATQSIATGQAFTKNTKVNTMFDSFAATPLVVGSVATVTITATAGTFSAGVVRAICYYEQFSNMGTAA